MRACFFPLLLLLLGLITVQPASAEERHTRLSLLAEHDVIAPGETLWLAVRQDIDDHWHTYWKNAGDSGAPMQINWVVPDGLTLGEMQWPAPQRLPFEGLMNFGYENQAIMLIPVTISDDVEIGQTHRLTADIEVLVCNKICIPEYDILNVDVTIGDRTAPEDHMALFEQARAALPEARSWPARYRDIDDVFQISFDPEGSFANATDVFFFPDEWGVIENAAAQKIDGDGKTYTIHTERGTRPLKTLKTIQGVLTWEDDGGIAHAVLLSAERVFSAVVAEQTPPKTASTALSTALLFAFLGGLILNLMPCVFPVLSIKALSLSQLSAKTPGIARLHGIAYTLGIMISFAVIALALIGLKATGSQIGWGFQLQNPYFVLILCYVLFLLSLNLSGFFEFQLNFGNLGGKLAGKEGPTGSFFTGILATLVATPCTAPFMGVAMGFALTQPVVVGLSVFIALGLGLAAPYLLLSFVPALYKALPKPGPWMVTFKKILALPMYASALWLVWVFSQQVDMNSLLAGLIGASVLSIAVWLINHHKQFGIAVLILGLAVPLFFVQPYIPDRPNNNGVAEQAFTQEKLDQLLQRNDAVFVNMTAAWCITCKVNEKIALSTEDTKALLREKNIHYLKGDWTNRNPEITAFLNKYDRQGVPLYVYYPPRASTDEQRPDPVILPQLLTQQIVNNTLE